MNSRQSLKSSISSLSSWSIIVYLAFITSYYYNCFNNNNNAIIFVSANPDGAGSCNSSYAPVDYVHVEATSVASKSLATDYPDITVTFNDRIIKFNDTKPMHYLLDTNKVYEWKIRSTSCIMRGILMRVQAPEGTSTNVTNVMLVSSRHTQMAWACDYLEDNTVKGITHFNPRKKRYYSGYIKFTEKTLNVLFEITMIKYAEETRSEFAYGQFKGSFL